MIVSFDPNVRLPLWDSPAACREAIRAFLPFANIVKLSDDELEFVTGCRDEREAAQKAAAARSQRLLEADEGGDDSDLDSDADSDEENEVEHALGGGGGDSEASLARILRLARRTLRDVALLPGGALADAVFALPHVCRLRLEADWVNWAALCRPPWLLPRLERVSLKLFSEAALRAAAAGACWGGTPRAVPAAWSGCVALPGKK